MALVSPTFFFVYIQEFGYYILSGHVEVKEVTVKLSKMKGHNFSNTIYSKAIRLHFTMQYQQF